MAGRLKKVYILKALDFRVFFTGPAVEDAPVLWSRFAATSSQTARVDSTSPAKLNAVQLSSQRSRPWSKSFKATADASCKKIFGMFIFFIWGFSLSKGPFLFLCDSHFGTRPEQIRKLSCRLTAWQAGPVLTDRTRTRPDRKESKRCPAVGRQALHLWPTQGARSTKRRQSYTARFEFQNLASEFQRTILFAFLFVGISSCRTRTAFFGCFDVKGNEFLTEFCQRPARSVVPQQEHCLDANRKFKTSKYWKIFVNFLLDYSKFRSGLDNIQWISNSEIAKPSRDYTNK